MEKLYWADDSMSGFVEINFDKKTIGRERGIRKIVKDDIPDVKHAITQFIKDLEFRNKEIDAKLSQTKETINIPIENGYKIRNKPTPAMREKLTIRKKENIARIKELKAFNIASLIK